MGKVIDMSKYKIEKDLNELAQRVADIIAMIELIQGKIPVCLINDKGELVELGGEREEGVPELIVPPHLTLADDDPDDYA